LSIAGTASAIGVRYLRTDMLKKPELRGWPESFAFELTELEKESGCIYLERLRYVDNLPVFYDINHLPNINLPRFTSRSLENKSLFEELRKNYQIQILGGEQQLKAINPDSHVKKILKLKSEKPVLYIERKLITNKEGFNIYSTIYFNSEKHTISGIF